MKLQHVFRLNPTHEAPSWARYDPTTAAFVAEQQSKRQASVFNEGAVKPVTLSFEDLSFEVDVGAKKNRQACTHLKSRWPLAIIDHVAVVDKADFKRHERPNPTG